MGRGWTDSLRSAGVDVELGGWVKQTNRARLDHGDDGQLSRFTSRVVGFVLTY
ncbi:MAG: hypothetical protein JWN34_5221 [Bryobacterales bacterium]|nr:hypothetical protein [Bryobacterales bacterium]